MLEEEARSEKDIKIKAGKMRLFQEVSSEVRVERENDTKVMMSERHSGRYHASNVRVENDLSCVGLNQYDYYQYSSCFTSERASYQSLIGSGTL